MRIEKALADGGYVAVRETEGGITLEVGCHGEGMAAVDLAYPEEIDDVGRMIFDLEPPD